ncbi:hypothetical protein EYF80_025520 [Liparis tanakae]|uniref:Uncharacterized protein n=1 Tax=Liparis tanakae TaxID=230148 RepID=A0A4Z2HEK9_9TELE|nr:hypothetical protein EYF80_025520 [Liparis tanakae]
MAHGNRSIPTGLEGGELADKDPTDSQLRSTCGTWRRAAGQSQRTLFARRRKIDGWKVRGCEEQ